MKQNINPIAIVGILVVLAIGIFFAYRQLSAPPAIPPEAREDHKDMDEFYRTQGHPGQGQSKK